MQKPDRLDEGAGGVICYHGATAWRQGVKNSMFHYGAGELGKTTPRLAG
jgi:hypothetical protein